MTDEAQIPCFLILSLLLLLLLLLLAMMQLVVRRGRPRGSPASLFGLYRGRIIIISFNRRGEEVEMRRRSIQEDGGKKGIFFHFGLSQEIFFIPSFGGGIRWEN